MYIDKPKMAFRGANLFFGALLIKGTIEQIAKRLNLFPLSTSVSQMIESSKLKSKPTIRYMTDEEVMKYLIEVSNGKKE